VDKVKRVHVPVCQPKGLSIKHGISTSPERRSIPVNLLFFSHLFNSVAERSLPLLNLVEMLC
jgi:hypothetical protein